MTIAILGSGALGLYYGTRLALAGHDVRFLIRSDLPTIRARGSILAHLNESQETLELRPAAAFTDTADIGPVDLVFVTLKATANDSLAQLLPPLLHPDTAVLTIQNGLGPDEHLASLVGAHRVLSGLGIIGATRTAPAEVTVYRAGFIILGEFSGPASDRTRHLADTLDAAHIRIQLTDDVHSARWHKLVWNVPFNGLAIAAGGLTTDRICTDPALVARARALMQDVQRAAAAHYVTITDTFIEEQLRVTPPMGAYQPSSLVDYLAGREVELDPIWGEPLRRARAKGIDTPALAQLYADLRTKLAPKR